MLSHFLLYLSMKISVKCVRLDNAFEFFKKDFIYLIERERAQAGGAAGRGRREKQAPSRAPREPNVRLDPRTLRS